MENPEVEIKLMCFFSAFQVRRDAYLISTYDILCTIWDNE